MTSLFLCASAQAQTCPAGVNDKPGIVGTWTGAGRLHGDPVEQIAIKYVPAKTTYYTSCKWVTERGGFPSFGIVKYEVCEQKTNCISPYYEATITHITLAANEVNKKRVTGKVNGDWLYFDVQSDNLLRFWVKPKNNTSSNKEIDYVLWTMNGNDYSETWIKVTKNK